MAGDIDRKKLWGRAGSRCVVCNLELTQHEGLETIVGDEAHIRSPKPGGPRYDLSYDPSRVDTYSNLILLCKLHHKLIDDNAGVFPADVLDELKNRHETRVSRSLEDHGRGWAQEPELELIEDGTTLTALLQGALACAFSNDHPTSDNEGEVIGRFLQAAREWADISSDVDDHMWRVRTAMSLDEQLKELEGLGFEVYGGEGMYPLRPGMIVPTPMVQVVRKDVVSSDDSREMDAERDARLNDPGVEV